jgi:Fe-S cluster biogenesis protein NfuA
MGLVNKVTMALERSVLPSVIARGGTVRVVDVQGGIATLEVRGSPGAVLPLASRIQQLLRARIRLEGGCQGCSLAEVTIRQGIEPLLLARVPELVGLADVTDHAAGTTPFFSAEKR